MCGRYYIDPDDDMEIKLIIDKIKDKFLDIPEIAEMKTGEIFPTNTVPAITRDSHELMKWGFSRFDGKGHIINARFETAGEKSMFSKPLISSRCIIPASHYFEWEKREGEAKKQKMEIGADSTLYMAGLFRREKDLSLPVFVILTMPARPRIINIHDRMPVLLHPDIRGAWLDHAINYKDIISYVLPEEELYYNEA